MVKDYTNYTYRQHRSTTLPTSPSWTSLNHLVVGLCYQYPWFPVPATGLHYPQCFGKDRECYITMATGTDGGSNMAAAAPKLVSDGSSGFFRLNIRVMWIILIIILIIIIIIIKIIRVIDDDVKSSHTHTYTHTPEVVFSFRALTRTHFIKPAVYLSIYYPVTLTHTDTHQYRDTVGLMSGSLYHEIN